MNECPERWWVQSSPYNSDQLEVVSNMPTGLDDPEDVRTHRGHFVAGRIMSPERAEAIALLPELLEEVAKVLKPYDQDVGHCAYPQLRALYNKALGIHQESPDERRPIEDRPEDPDQGAH